MNKTCQNNQGLLRLLLDQHVINVSTFYNFLTTLRTDLGCRGPIRVPIWHIEAYHPDLRSWTPLGDNDKSSRNSIIPNKPCLTQHNQHHGSCERIFFCSERPES